MSAVEDQPIAAQEVPSPELPRIEALADGLKLLEALAELEHATLSQLARHAHLTANKTFRMIGSLRSLGYVEWAGNKTYRLGRKVLLLGHRCSQSDPLMVIAAPEMSRLTNETGEGAFLGVRVGLSQITIASCPPPLGWRMARPTRPQLPLHTGSIGICLLANSPPAVMQAVLDGPRQSFTEVTLTDREKLAHVLERTRQEGYRISSDEVSFGWTSIAAPIFDRGGFAIAAVAIGVSNQRLSDEQVARNVAAVRKTAAAITSLLPATGPTLTSLK